MKWILAVLVMAAALVFGCRSAQPTTPSGEPAAGPAAGGNPDGESGAAEPEKVPERARGEGPIVLPGRGAPMPKVADKDSEIGKFALSKWHEDRAARALSLHYLHTGIAAYNKHDYITAEHNFRLAVRLWPTNKRAVDYLLMTQMLLDKRSGEVKSVAEWLKDLRRVLIDQKKRELERDYQAARRLYNEGEYSRSEKTALRVLEQIRWFPYKLEERHDLEQKARALRADALKRLKETREQEEERKLVRAQKLATVEEMRRVEQERAKIKEMLQKAQEAIYLARFKRAKKICEEILLKEPGNSIAKQLLKFARRFKHAVHVSQTNYNLRQQLKMTKLLNDAAQIPQAEYVIWPSRDFWLDRVCKRAPGIAEEEEQEPEEIKRMRKKLATTPVSLRFQDTALRDVIQFLQDVTGLNIAIDPNVDATQTVTLRIDKVVLKNALELIMKQVDLGYTFREGVIWIGEKQTMVEKLILEIYNVSDVIARIPSFTGPDIRVLSPEESGGPGGGPGGLPIDEEEEGEDWGLDPLKELIEMALGEAAQREGCSIEGHRGQLIVVNTREVHKRIREILNQLRRNFGLFVYIEVRFITVEDTLLEDLGICYRGLGNGSQWIPVTPPPPLLPNFTGGTDPGIGRRVPGRGPEEWAGRIQNDWADVFAGVPGVARPPDAGLWLQSTWIEPFQLNALLHARTEDIKSHTLTAASITAHNRQRVYIAVINQRAYIADYDTSGAGGMTPVEVAEPVVKNFQEGIVIDVQPIVSSDRRYVTVNVRATYSHLLTPTLSTIVVNLGTTAQTVIQGTIEIPEVGIDRIFTSVTVPDGGTILLGGFRQAFKRKYVSTVPVFGSIPILGWAFRSTGWVKIRRDVLMLLTARIIILRDEEKAMFGEQAVKTK